MRQTKKRPALTFRHNETAGREVGFDYLRVAAVLAVITSRVSPQSWDAIDLRSFDGQILYLYDGLPVLSIALFPMISGALFLSRDIPVKKLYSKYILRIVTAFLF